MKKIVLVLAVLVFAFSINSVAFAAEDASAIQFVGSILKSPITLLDKWSDSLNREDKQTISNDEEKIQDDSVFYGESWQYGG